MEVVQNATEEYNLWKGQADYIDEWFLMSTPYPIMAIIASYLLFVLKLGPDFMKKRQPLDLSNVILLYNVFQVLFSVFLVNFGTQLLARHGFLTSECIVDKKTMLPVAIGTYYYFSAKISELLDTIFFVLRKKNNQVSFLHVYHHTVVVISTWWALKYEVSFTPIFLGTLNSFVHVVMYGYYALSTFPALSPYLWWKKYITKLQLAQFVLVLIQVTTNYFSTGCPPSYFLVTLILFNVGLMIYLFSDFYAKSYSNNQKHKDDNLEKETTATKNGKRKIVDSINNNNSAREKIH